MNANLPTMAVNTNASILWGAISVLALLGISCNPMDALAKVCLLSDFAPPCGISYTYTWVDVGEMCPKNRFSDEKNF